MSPSDRRPSPAGGRALGRIVARLVALALAAGALAYVAPRSSAREVPEQPVAFNHSAHINKVGMSCTKCHAGAEKNQRAGFPPDIYCEACHSSPRTDSPAEAKLISMLENGETLAWRQVTNLADYVYFSHRRHAGIGNIDCSVCHGQMSERTVPITVPAVNFNRRRGMLRCIGCHQESGSRYAHIDCVDCHR